MANLQFPSNIRTALDTLKNRTSSATGYVDAIKGLFDVVIGTSNPWGTGATTDIGTGEGNIPVLDSTGKLPAGVIPPAASTGAAARDDATLMARTVALPTTGVADNARFWGSGTTTNWGSLRAGMGLYVVNGDLGFDGYPPAGAYGIWVCGEERGSDGVWSTASCGFLPWGYYPMAVPYGEAGTVETGFAGITIVTLVNKQSSQSSLDAVNVAVQYSLYTQNGAHTIRLRKFPGDTPHANTRVSLYLAS